jgi:DNA-directed RNA polymerase specialized sigma24 family protein
MTPDRDDLSAFLETGDEAALNRYCIRLRPDLADLVRRYRVEGYDLEDLVQEAFVAFIPWIREMRECGWSEQGTARETIERHVSSLKRRVKRKQAKLVQMHDGWADWDEGISVLEDDVGARAGSSLGALELLIACQQECRNDRDRELLNLLIGGFGYWGITRELGLSYKRAAKQVLRLRQHLRPAILEEF